MLSGETITFLPLPSVSICNSRKPKSLICVETAVASVKWTEYPRAGEAIAKSPEYEQYPASLVPDAPRFPSHSVVMPITIQVGETKVQYMRNAGENG